MQYYRAIADWATYDKLEAAYVKKYEKNWKALVAIAWEYYHTWEDRKRLVKAKAWAVVYPDRRKEEDPILYRKQYHDLAINRYNILFVEGALDYKLGYKEEGIEKIKAAIYNAERSNIDYSEAQHFLEQLEKANQ